MENPGRHHGQQCLPGRGLGPALVFGIPGDPITAILMFCVVGSFAINNDTFDIGMMLAMGILGYVFEANGIPVAPVVLGLVLGPILEQNFMVSMIKTQWSLVPFFTRPVAALLGVMTILTWLVPLYPTIFGWLRRRPASG